MSRARQSGQDVPPPPQGDAKWRRSRRGEAAPVPAVGPGALEQAGPQRRQAQFEAVVREFKTKPCNREGSQSSSHDHRCCPFFHGERDRRRLVFAENGRGEPLYRAEPCGQQFDDRRVCKRGDRCDLCHSTAELLYHPEFFRKRLCHQAGRCPRGRLCAFAHTRHELLVPYFSEAEEADPSEDFIAYNFKTQWCPIGGPHDWENCVYAHTYRDWRRSPEIGYSSWPCPLWTRSISAGGAELMYQDRCPHGMSCSMAHGAKEQLYHPQFYKTSPCNESNCKRGALCAFTHDARDTRPSCRDEGPGPHAERGALPWAEQMLARLQPTYWHPPRYHAFEDTFREYNNSAGFSKGRGGKKGSAASKKGSTASSARVWREEWRDEELPVEPYFCQDEGEPAHASAAATYTPYMFCQWMPCPEASPELAACAGPSLGYPEAAESWMAPAAFGYTQFDMGCGGQMVWGAPLQQQGFIDVVPNSEPTQLELSRQQPGPVARAGFDFGAVAGPGPPPMPSRFAVGQDLGALEWDWKCSSSAGGQCAAIGAEWQGPNVEFFRAPRIETSALSKKKSRKGDGLRTPSSLGSPQESATPTEEPSPRPAEATGSSLDGQADSISDDTALDGPAVAVRHGPI